MDPSEEEIAGTRTDAARQEIFQNHAHTHVHSCIHSSRDTDLQLNMIYASFSDEEHIGGNKPSPSTYMHACPHINVYIQGSRMVDKTGGGKHDLPSVAVLHFKGADLTGTEQDLVR